MGVTFSSPRPITENDDASTFDSGAPTLDDWLRRRARANQASGASRTYVLCEDERVLAYYALASGAVELRSATGRFRRNMPDPVPVAVLGRLAIDRSRQGRGLGRALVRDAALRVTQAADIIGIRGLLVHSLSAEAERFYLALGFEPSRLESRLLMATVSDLRAALE